MREKMLFERRGVITYAPANRSAQAFLWGHRALLVVLVGLVSYGHGAQDQGIYLGAMGAIILSFFLYVLIARRFLLH
ncbi:hypothetical protein NON00_14300 [Roseomonas sp. GC11]|uniref:hypothetical protein n=1 Tax=Roseomonas sp. GC11 TaxID=2950546 RepID=UPI00210E4B9E|nr:hypothetical protein [Roseomonas sp. GC11]MCQ4161092.1 hypothetical protein [Roseomonas sp. GC11]